MGRICKWRQKRTARRQRKRSIETGSGSESKLGKGSNSVATSEVKMTAEEVVGAEEAEGIFRGSGIGFDTPVELGGDRTSVPHAPSSEMGVDDYKLG